MAGNKPIPAAYYGLEKEAEARELYMNLNHNTMSERECNCPIESDCCGADIPLWPDMDICLECKEHTEPAECECEEWEATR